MCSLKVVVYSGKACYDHFFVHKDRLIGAADPSKCIRSLNCDGDFDENGFEIVSHQDILPHPEGESLTTKKKVKFCLTMNALHFSYFVNVLNCSRHYRHLVLTFFLNMAKISIPFYHCVRLRVRLTNPPEQPLDHEWCHRISLLVMERSELDSAMSWLSTLGGAYSALGDHFSHCAHMAGRISLQQFKLALRLGDPSTVARCKLYIALSLIQTNRFKLAQNLIQDQYQIAVDSPCPDIRLVRMCKGIWSKLRYEHSRYIEKKKRSRPSILQKPEGCLSNENVRIC